MMETDRLNDKQNRMETNLSPEEVEALKVQIIQMQEQIGSMSDALSRIDPRVVVGLKPVGLFLYYTLLPLYWLMRGIKRFVSIAARMAMLLTKPSFYWSGLYWISFGWVVILDGGIKDLAIPLKPRTIVNIVRTLVR